MLVNRNTIKDAFQALFTGIGPTGTNDFLTVSPIWKTFSDTPGEQQPALYTLGIEERVSEQTVYGGPKWKIKTTVWVYYLAPGDGVTDPEVELNRLIDLVDRAIKPQYSTETQTLGLEGVVTNCYIDGTVIKVIGVLGPQTVAVVPVTIDVAG